MLQFSVLSISILFAFNQMDFLTTGFNSSSAFRPSGKDLCEIYVCVKVKAKPRKKGASEAQQDDFEKLTPSLG